MKCKHGKRDDACVLCAYAAGKAEGKSEERADVVAFLRSKHATLGAQRISAGEHVGATGKDGAR